MLNNDKTNYMLFSTKKVNPSTSGLSIDGSLIKRAEAASFLGITFDELLNWKQHMGSICPKLTSCVYPIA